MQPTSSSGLERPKAGLATRRPDLVNGLYFHLAIFAAAILVLFLINSSTRGDAGEWWIVWPIQMWSMAWGLHLWGVLLASEASKQQT